MQAFRERYATLFFVDWGGRRDSCLCFFRVVSVAVGIRLVVRRICFASDFVARSKVDIFIVVFLVFVVLVVVVLEGEFKILLIVEELFRSEFLLEHAGHRLVLCVHRVAATAFFETRCHAL